MRCGAGRGQVLVLAALTISLAILSTQAYVYQRSKTETPASWSALSDYVLSIEQGSRHVVVASLINVSGGGSSSIFSSNLDRWESFVAGDYQFGRCDLNSTAASQTPYTDGFWLYWGTNGRGISSAYADLTLNLSGRGVEIGWSFTENITTTVLVSGSYQQLDQQSKRINVNVNVLNEGEPTLAGNITLSYRKEGDPQWRDPAEQPASDCSYQDLGNGTYQYSFTIDSEAGETIIYVRAQVYDRRDVFVQAENQLGAG